MKKGFSHFFKRIAYCLILSLLGLNLAPGNRALAMVYDPYTSTETWLLVGNGCSTGLFFIREAIVEGSLCVEVVDWSVAGAAEGTALTSAEAGAAIAGGAEVSTLGVCAGVASGALLAAGMVAVYVACDGDEVTRQCNEADTAAGIVPGSFNSSMPRCKL